MSRRWRIMTLVLLFAALVAMGTPVGAYLNSYLFLQPAMKLRAALGLRPTLDPRVRLVLFEDRSLEKLGRGPTFAEWRQVGDLLLDAGYKRVFLVGFGAGADGAVDLGTHRPGFYAGAVVTEEASNSRAERLAAIPPRVLVENRTPDAPAAAEAGTWAILPEAASLASVDGLGNLNLLANSEMPAGFRVGEAHVLPNMGLLVAEALHWEDGDPFDAGGRIPTSPGGRMYVDFVDPVKSLANALPVSGFYQATGYDKVRSTLHPNFKEKLRGGEIAVLVADAYTGARFVDTPNGKVLSYFAVVSVMNSVLSRTFVYPPLPVPVFLLISLPFLFLLLTRTRAQTSLKVTAAATIVWGFGCVALLLLAGWILPCTEVAFAAAVGWLLRLAHHLTVTLGEKLALSREMDMGRTVQQMLLPKQRKGRIGGFEYQVLYRPYWSMAGDWYQVHEEEHRGVLAFGDGVGKGPSAALNTAVIAAAWASSRQKWKDGPIDAPLFARTIDHLVRSTFGGDQCTTLSIVTVEDGVLQIGACAAQKWLHYSAENKAMNILKNPKSDLLGLGPEGYVKPLEMRDLVLANGDFLLGFTDGVFDGTAGVKRFAAIVEHTRPEFHEQDIFDLVTQLSIDAGRADVLPDDQTLVMIRRSDSIEVRGAVNPADAEGSEERHVI